MTASVVKHDPNTKRFKNGTLIYFNTDTYSMLELLNLFVKIKKRSLEPFCVWI